MMLYWMKHRVWHSLHCNGSWSDVYGKDSCPVCGVWKHYFTVSQECGCTAGVLTKRVVEANIHCESHGYLKYLELSGFPLAITTGTESA